MIHLLGMKSTEEPSVVCLNKCIFNSRKEEGKASQQGPVHQQDVPQVPIKLPISNSSNAILPQGGFCHPCAQEPPCCCRNRLVNQMPYLGPLVNVVRFCP